MSEALSEAFARLPDYLGQHVLLCASALALALLAAVPLVLASRRSPAARALAMGFASLVQTIPGLALMALFYPLLLALSALTAPLGFSLPALGFLPAVLALTLYALLPVLRNAIAGLDGVDPALRQAALAVGMTPRQMFWQVEAPLAAPVVMAGVRTAAVWTIGAATLATTVGQTSLGNYIFSGLQTENWVAIVFGCIVSAALALAADALLGFAEMGIRERRRTPVVAAALAVAAGIALAVSPLVSRVGEARAAVIGAKNFSEQFILAELMASRLEAAGLTARHRQGLGSAIAFRALAANDLDVYVDYSGTLWTNVLGRTDALPRQRMNAELARELRARYGVVVLGGLGFENAYALAMRRERAQEIGAADIADLAARGGSLAFGTDMEFQQRPEWRALSQAYGLSFAAMRSYAPTFMYRALQSGEADVIAAFSSDGRIAADDLLVLSDSRQAIPAYDALILVAPARARDERFLAALRPLLGRIDVEAMRRANHLVDRDADKRTPREAAVELSGALRP